jgi:hypothetical protein
MPTKSTEIYQLKIVLQDENHSEDAESLEQLEWIGGNFDLF